jgi:hypothetical protein
MTKQRKRRGLPSQSTNHDRQGQSWGRTAQDEEEKEAPEQVPRDKADSWLRAVAGEDDKVKNMILRDLVGGDKDFLNA